MGRGLSDLQKFILRKAARQPRVYYCEICEGFYNWEPKSWFGVKDGGGFCRSKDGNLKYPGTQYFSRAEIGEKEYTRVMAAISRSCLLLQERGLVKCITVASSHWSGVVITEKGRQFI